MTSITCYMHMKTWRQDTFFQICFTFLIDMAYLLFFTVLQYLNISLQCNQIQPDNSSSTHLFFFVGGNYQLLLLHI